MKLLLVAFFSLLSVPLLSQKSKTEWKQLFNGRDLSNWDTWLRAPNMTGYNDHEMIGPPQPAIGLNNDPLKVFTVSDGILRISGEVWGAITTREEYGNYHLRFETRWGEKKYFPKDKSLRDGGLLFHCTGAFDHAFKCWMRSMEMQVQETEIGDFFNVGGGVAEIPVEPKVKTNNNEVADQYDPLAPLSRHPGRVYRSGNFESPNGEWTTSEMVARHSDAVFIVNGFVVNRLFNIYRDDLLEQVVKGKLQFQSEGAEHYYRKIEIRPISFKIPKPKLQANLSEVAVSDNQQTSLEILNTGEPVEIIAVELLGKQIDQFSIELPSFPLLMKKGSKMVLRISRQKAMEPGRKIKLRMETVLGPVENFSVDLVAK